MPEVGHKVDTEEGSGTVISIDIPNRKYIILTEDNNKLEIKLPNKCEKCEKKCSK